MTVREARAFGEIRLRQISAEESLSDSTVLLCHAWQTNRASLLALQDEILPENVFEVFSTLIQKRRDGWPCAYLTGHKEFFSLDFVVDSRVLIPRPDTEILVEKVLRAFDQSPKTVHDCCTGSGAIAISLQKSRPAWIVSASDISSDALDVCRINSRNILGSEIPLTRSDLLSDIQGSFDAITANPPYLTVEETQERLNAGWKEPESALTSGQDGLFHSGILIRQAFGLLKPGGMLFLESAPPLMGELRKIFENEGYSDITIERDLSSLERVITGKKGF